MHAETLYQVALGLVPGIGAVTAKKLIEHCGSAAAVFQNSRRELQQIPGINSDLVRQLLQPGILQRAESDLVQAEQHNISILSLDDERYPSRLRQNRDSPLVLFVKGQTNLNQRRMVAIVGTRKPSRHGIDNCERIVAELSGYQATIISGMAYGIDICAHRAALDQGLPTWAVMAHGHQYIYPAAHRHTAQQILESGGSLIAEYSFSTHAEKEFFPMRNRIVAGLCDALIVVETAQRGGSMITAQLANQYYRDVFAFPGRVKDPLSQGCNLLIKGHQAALLESAADLAYVLRWETPATPSVRQQELFVELSPEEKKIVALLQQKESISIDELANQLASTSGTINSDLLSLEFKNLIKSLPGQRYSLK